jgi:L-aspartate oxidase
MKGLPAETDFVVIGAGVSGLRAAIELATAGRVLVLAKKEAALPEARSNASDALSDEDEISLRLQDTLTSGDGLCDPSAVKILMEEGAERIEELISWVKHSHPNDAKLVFGQEGAAQSGARSHNRILHAQGESTGTEILRALQAKAHSLKHVTIAPFVFTTTLLTENERVTGISALDDKGVPLEIACSAVLLATGGMGQIYRNTTNSETATGDGIALAYRAGAEAGDMEFIQVHPTALYIKKAPHFLLPEALRAEGGVLRNIELDRFMGKYHPMGELAPRDLMSRAIIHEMEVSRAKDPFVYLDLTHLNAAKVQKRFPRIYATLVRHNVDITEDLIPVRPGAHFAMGGVRTDFDGRTNVAGLYAAGETATTAVHGANRLASNSLLEGLVYGARAGKAMREELKLAKHATGQPKAAYSNGPVDTGLEETIGQIQDLMWKEVGIVRMRSGMQKAVKNLEEIAPKLAHSKTRRGHEAANLHLTALLVARSALAREESRGAHYRIDYPDHDDKKFLKHSVIRGDGVRFV